MTDKEIVLAKYPNAFVSNPWWIDERFMYIQEGKNDIMNLSGSLSLTEAKAWEKAANIIKKQQKQNEK